MIEEGAGNAVFPLLESNKNPKLSLFAYDYSSHAVKLVQVISIHPLAHQVHLLKCRYLDKSLISQTTNWHDPKRRMGSLLTLHFAARH